MARPTEYSITCTKPTEHRIFTECFSWEDYDTPNDLRIAVANYCNNSVDLGWDVIAHDSDGKIIFTFSHEV